MQRVIGSTRYLVVLPVIGLAIAASVFFVFGGIGLIKLLIELTITAIGSLTGAAHQTTEVERGLIIFEVVEYVHLFLVGTVLYITAIGLYQLFVQEIQFPDWLKIDSTEELETSLIGVTVVVLAVNFMGAVFVGGETEDLLQYGAGIALPIAALGLFIGLRAWATKLSNEVTAAENGINPASTEIQASLKSVEE
ncbi:MAG: YqhA family protein [Anaerolineales bacterium]|nr:YqhA family protein [Anaerolineales bacterium]